MHMKSDALKTVSQMSENSGEEKEINISANRTWNRFFLSTHIPQGLNSGAEARRKEKKK